MTRRCVFIVALVDLAALMNHAGGLFPSGSSTCHSHLKPLPRCRWKQVRLNEDGRSIDVTYRNFDGLSVDLEHLVARRNRLYWIETNQATPARASSVLNGWMLVGRVCGVVPSCDKGLIAIFIVPESRNWWTSSWCTDMVADCRVGVAVTLRFQGPGTTTWFDGEHWRHSRPHYCCRRQVDPCDLAHWIDLEMAGELYPWPGCQLWFDLILETLDLDADFRQSVISARSLCTSSNLTLTFKHCAFCDSDGERPPAFVMKRLRLTALPERRASAGLEGELFEFIEEPNAPVAALVRCLRAYNYCVG